MSILRLPARQQVRVLLLSSLVMLAACGEKPQQAGGEMKVPVSVVTVEPTPTEVFVELPGRVEAIKEAEIRARVNGIVQEINFEQGSDVKSGQLLFTIDPAPYIAQRDQAAAQLKNAEADIRSARLFADRYAKLIKANAVSRQEYDNAVAQAGQAEAAVAAAKAALQSANINLGYTRVESPIDGRIGRSMVTEGALVSAASATQMATVQQLDRVYVDIPRSVNQLAQLRRAMAEGVLTRSAEGDALAYVLLEDGAEYEHPGKLLFSGVSVDPGTGQVSLRAEFENPDQILLPGMYVRVRLQQGMDEKALLVPQQAIQRTSDGLNSVYVVREGKVQPVAVSVGPQIKGSFLVYKGLNPGDVVVVEGFQKIRPGAAVQPIPWKQAGAKPGSQPGGPAGAQPEPEATPKG
ncbi:efflux RND transporter periplasmic adaptor subunit [Pollutimonas thiosulfatoxidans]|uniref:Efflux transporter periplasmic adaptor subunit n=1 Tax=Pollutimonas thiosulfatoxidans TaxID=2028345 RepID=A0A410GB07_9BURK|nr:efflux RND transporter periplasmic adaptor subunit [Pollutimonas thiosulfatoxidans]MBF6616282.1 efflux RND transporter periplasmic adaptor subunit [Candidimonas sp.]NYT45940.1 efflux RND transporter periplasmic adaptor subunit [Alcaligenaceae bacterium]QAA93478.1 efflux transporter periplasmic adaptor subunit [Pollutimonas thiosulfatoxidans]